MTSSQIHASIQGAPLGQNQPYGVNKHIGTGGGGSGARTFDGIIMRLRQLTDGIQHVAWCVNQTADRVIGFSASIPSGVNAPEVAEVSLMEQLNRLENQYKILVEALSRLDLVDPT